MMEPLTSEESQTDETTPLAGRRIMNDNGHSSALEMQNITAHHLYPTFTDTPRQMPNKRPTHPGCYFRDGRRRVDYVMVFRVTDADGDGVADEQVDETTERKYHRREEKRQNFEENVLAHGLELEYETVEKEGENDLCFIKVHGPWAVLAKQAEMMKLKMPIKVNDVEDEISFGGILNSLLNRCNAFRIRAKYRLDEPDTFTAPFVVERAHQFIIFDKDLYFPAAQRTRMVHEILSRVSYDATRPDRVGVARMVTNGAYEGAYPLHEGPLESDVPSYEKSAKTLTDRQLLHQTWSRFKNFFKEQPLDLIRRYLGEKIGIYFAWLGYYTKMLFIASILGIICVIYGAATIKTYIPSNEICNASLNGDTVMCPNCDIGCSFWKLNESCTYSRITHMFDNTFTVVFAAFMTIWATLFMEGWKRYQAEIAWEWDLMDFDLEEEAVRPEFQAKVKGRRINPITREAEPYMHIGERVARVCGSLATVFFFLLLVCGFVLGVIIYRIIIVHVLYKDPYAGSYAKILTTITAAFLNLICIMILGRIYQHLAYKLTQWERPRTESDFENSYALKVFLFQFINYYSSLFYIAFFKGKVSTLPGSSSPVEARARIFGRYRWESCDPSGCMVELVIQLAIIMCGKQFFNNFCEIFLPMISNWWRYRGAKKVGDDDDDRHKKEDLEQWEQDYLLNPVPQMFMFTEYLEMVLQYGFVTLFVSAFPLAPFFAFLNNILEIRVDAFKFIAGYRRPTPARVNDIGIWKKIIDGISALAVLTNACVIAFTSDFVPRMMYLFAYSTTNDLTGFTDHSLSYYDSRRLTADNNSTVCRFRDYRQPPCSLALPDRGPCDPATPPLYAFTLEWWHVLAAKLAFIIVFEHLVFLIKGLVAYFIPDIPTRIYIKVQREAYLSKQALRSYQLYKKQHTIPERASPPPEGFGTPPEDHVSKVPVEDGNPVREGQLFHYSPRTSNQSLTIDDDARVRI